MKIIIGIILGGVLSATLLLNCHVSSGSSSNRVSLPIVGTKPTSNAVRSPTKEENDWKAGEFRSIKVGSDHRNKALQILGKPIWTGAAPNEAGYIDLDLNPEIWDQFKNVDEMYTLVTVMSSKKDGRILGIEAAVPSLPVETVLSRFGEDYQRKEYIDILCREDDPDSLMMVEGQGEYSQIYYVYPHLGIAVVTQSKTHVIAVQYRSKPLVPEGAKCTN